MTVWIADFKTDSLYAINPYSGEVTAVLEAPSYRPYGLAWDGAYLWVVDGEEFSIIQFDIESGVNIKTIASPVEAPRGLCWDGEYLWLSDKTTIRKFHPRMGPS